MELLLPTITFLASVLILRAIGLSSLSRFFIDKPDHRKVHQAAVPRFGGIGVILAFLLALCILMLPGMPGALPMGTLPAALAFISFFLLFAGGLDDVRPLDYKIKFLLQFALAGGVVLILGRDFDTIAILGHRFDLGWAGPILSIFWIVALMNAMNIIDGIDGLAGGVAVLAFATAAILCHANGAEARLLICLALIGATLGFLRLNFSRKHKTFLGDAGSQFLGAMVAILAMEIQAMPKTGNSFLVPLFIAGYPLTDISVAMVRRFKCGGRRGLGRRFLRMFAADNEHLHHRLVYLGLSHAQSTFLLLMVAGGIAATGVIISRVGWPWRPLIMGYLAAAVLLILNRLGYLGRKHWLTFPRAAAEPSRVVGVIEPDEVFLHSLNSFKQDKFSFQAMPGKQALSMAQDLVAVTLYNASSVRFDEDWTRVLRATEIQDCPAVVIAEAKDIERARARNPERYRTVHFIEKPLRIPELIRVLEKVSRPSVTNTRAPARRRFPLAATALRKRGGAVPK